MRAGSMKTIASLLALCVFGIIQIHPTPANTILWEKGQRPQLPVDLILEGTGPSVLIWKQRLDPGYYTLHAQFAMGMWRRDFLFSVDHKPAGTFSAYFTREGGGKPPIYNLDFIITEPGEHELRLDRRVEGFLDQDPILRIESLEVVTRPHPQVPQVNGDTHPAISYGPLWGWMPSSLYQRRGDRPLSRQYWDRRIIEESAKWGSNYIQLFPYACENYLRDGDFRDALAYARQWGFIVDQHSGWIGRPPVGDPGTTFGEVTKKMDQRFSHWLDLTKDSATCIPDGWESEDGNPDPAQEPLNSMPNMIESVRRTWRYHPGAMIGECWRAPLSYKPFYDQWLHEGFHGPNYAKILMCAGALFGNGYDDFLSIYSFPDRLQLHNDYNWVWYTCQGDSRPYSDNFFSGGSMPDWITKQCWDFFRPNAESLHQGDPPLSSAQIWLGEPETCLPEDMRECVYALSMDPCRGALAYHLTSTGRDGTLFWSWRRWQKFMEMGKTDEKSLHGTYSHRFRANLAREWEPAHTLRLHNGFLATDRPAFGDGGPLTWDTENLGQFDLDARTVHLSGAFWRTEPAVSLAPVVELRVEAGAAPSQGFHLDIPPGSYELRVASDPGPVCRIEFCFDEQYLGGLTGGSRVAGGTFPFYAWGTRPHAVQVRRIGGEQAGALTLKVVPTGYRVVSLAEAGTVDDRCAEEGGPVELYRHQDVVRARLDVAGDKLVLPPALAGTSGQPRALELWFDGEPGVYLLAYRVRSTAGWQRLDVTLNSHLFADENYDPNKPGRYGLNDWKSLPGWNGRAGCYLISSNWKNIQTPLVIEHRSGRRRYMVELSVPAGSGRIELDALGLIRAPVRQAVVQLGGHESVVQETLERNLAGMRIHEERRLALVADEPTFFLDMKRQLEGDATQALWVMDCADYDTIEFDGRLATDADGMPPKVMVLKDAQCLRPPMQIHLLETAGLNCARWREGRIELSGRRRTQTVKLAVTLRGEDPAKVRTGLKKGSPARPITLGDKPRKVKNPAKTDSVVLAEVRNPSKGPYFVEEQGWWSVRPAQPLRASDDTWTHYLHAYEQWLDGGEAGVMPEPPHRADLVRMTIPAEGYARIQKYGFIENSVRPGWGSQKQMLINEVDLAGCKVWVHTLTPYTYAPRIEFRERFSRVRLNGRPWAYHDGRNVFLPQATGQYRINVERGIEPLQPTLQATAARVREAVYGGNAFRIEFTPPDYVFKLPEGVRYTFFIAHDPKRHAIITVEGGILLRTGHLGSIIEARDHLLRIQFQNKERCSAPAGGIKPIQELQSRLYKADKRD